MNIEQARFNMIEQQVRPWRVADNVVLSLMQSTPRETFVPPQYRALAFSDCDIPLSASARMFSPKIVARLLEACKVKRTDRVLEVGSGSGYMTALLAQQAHSVLSLEIDAELARAATQRLAPYANVTVKNTDGSVGAAGEALFDVIILNGVMSAVPSVILDQVKDGGHLIAMIGAAPSFHVQKFQRQGESWHVTLLFETEADALENFPQADVFVF